MCFDKNIPTKINIDLFWILTKSFDICQNHETWNFYLKNDDAVALFYDKFLPRVCHWLRLQYFSFMSVLFCRFMTGPKVQKKLMKTTSRFLDSYLPTTERLKYSLNGSRDTSLLKEK